MRWARIAIMLPLAVASQSLAVVQGPVQATPPPAAAVAPAPGTARFDIPVAWQLTKARMVGTGATTLTESFRETWTIELRAGGALYLHSPRAQVRAFLPGDAAPSGSVEALPGAVVVAERDFARLLGIRVEAEAAEVDPATPPGTPLTLQLANPSRGGADITLAWSEEEHYAVHFDVGGESLF